MFAAFAGNGSREHSQRRRTGWGTSPEASVFHDDALWRFGGGLDETTLPWKIANPKIKI